MAHLNEPDLRAVAQAVAYLEDPSLLIKFADLLGKPAEVLMGRLPKRAHAVLTRAVDKAMHKALDLAITSLDEQAHAAPGLHAASAAAVGGVGGFFGLAALPVELPISTALMLRSIAAIARDEGADLRDPAVRLECVAVLAMGGGMPAPIDAQFEDGGSSDPGTQPPLASMESSYWTSRIGLTLAIRSATQHAAQVTSRQVLAELVAGSTPAMARLLALLTGRFQALVGEKTVAQSLPLVGAATGAALNAAFAEHFNTVARHHFRLRRLEREHGESAVQHAYGRALQNHKANKAKKLGGS